MKLTQRIRLWRAEHEYDSKRHASLTEKIKLWRFRRQVRRQFRRQVEGKKPLDLKPLFLGTRPKIPTVRKPETNEPHPLSNLAFHLPNVKEKGTKPVVSQSAKETAARPKVSFKMPHFKFPTIKLPPSRVKTPRVHEERVKIAGERRERVPTKIKAAGMVVTLILVVLVFAYISGALSSLLGLFISTHAGSTSSSGNSQTAPPVSSNTNVVVDQITVGFNYSGGVRGDLVAEPSTF